jgi:hypothetical protein
MTTLFTEKTMSIPLSGKPITTFEQLVQALKEHIDADSSEVTLADVPSLEQLLLTFVAAPILAEGQGEGVAGNKKLFLDKCAEAYDAAHGDLGGDMTAVYDANVAPYSVVILPATDPRVADTPQAKEYQKYLELRAKGVSA